MKFEKILKATQKELIKILPKQLKFYGYNDIIKEDGYIYAKGDIPILLTAHMDTVHDEPVKQIFKSSNKWTSPQGIGGDDRCGIWIILQVIKELKPYILLCEDEEIGGVGSNKFCLSDYADDLDELKYCIEIDRANSKDAVFYDCGNEDFIKYIQEKTGYKKQYGSFSDISHLCPVGDIAGVNLSCGYYNAHTKQEYIMINEMQRTCDIIKKLLRDVPKERFDFQEIKHVYSYDFDDYNYAYMTLEVQYEENGEEDYDCVFCSGLTQGIGKFLMEHPTVTYNDILDYEIY